MKTIFLAFVAMFLSYIHVGYGQVTFYESFDGIGTSATATLPGNWKADKQTLVRTVGTYSSAVTVTEQRAGINMSNTAANGIYNYGDGAPTTATNRSVGFLSSSSSTKSGNLYCKFNNAGVSEITAVPLSYNIKKYRNGSNPSGFSVQLYFSFDGTTWTSAGPSFLTSFAADADNNGSATVPITTINVSQDVIVTIPAGADFYLCWNYSVTSTTTSSNAQGLGIDDVTISDVPLPVSLSSFNSSVNKNNVILTWVTDWEIFNAGFDIERKIGTSAWIKVGNKAGVGNSNTPTSYTFTDNPKEAGTYAYRLKQIDYNGNFEYFDLPHEVIIKDPKNLTLKQNFPNPFNPLTIIEYELPSDSKVTIRIFDIIGREVVTLFNQQQNAGYYEITFDGSHLSSGTYFYRIDAGDFTQIKKMLLIK